MGASRNFQRLNRRRWLAGMGGAWLARMGGRRRTEQRWEFEQPCMGTVFRLVVWGPEETAASAAMAAFERVEQLEQVLSDYREDSELSRVCRTAWREPQVISPELYEVLEASLEWGRITGGAVDVTVKPLVELWKLARHQGHLPDPELLAEARSRTGLDKMRLNPRTRSLRLAVPGMKLDLGAVGKGYAADQVLALLKSRGLFRVLVDGGGDLSLGEAPPGEEGWRIRLEEEGVSPRQIRLRRCSVATSGDRYQFLELDHVHYSHILDPRTGYGVTHQGSATVIAPQGIAADALATALCVLELEEGIRLAEGLDGVEARIVRRQGDGLVQLGRTRGFPA